jgi:hypothetical protein
MLERTFQSIWYNPKHQLNKLSKNKLFGNKIIININQRRESQGWQDYKQQWNEGWQNNKSY